VDKWRELLENSVRCLDSTLLRHRQMRDLFHPVGFIFFLTRLKRRYFVLTSLTSLMSPTSRCFASTPAPFVSAGPSVGPAPTGGHLDVIVPAPSPPSVKEEHKNHQLFFLFYCYAFFSRRRQKRDGRKNINKSELMKSQYNFVLLLLPRICNFSSFFFVPFNYFPLPIKKANSVSPANGQQFGLLMLDGSFLFPFCHDSIVH
jgi:hypothetical protein